MLRTTIHSLLVAALLACTPGCGDDKEKTPTCSSDNANSHSIGMACTKAGGECAAASLLCDADMIPDGTGVVPWNMCTKMCTTAEDCGEDAVCAASPAGGPPVCWLTACAPGD